MPTAVSAGPEQLAQDFSARLIMHLFTKLRFEFKKRKKKSITWCRFSAAGRSDVSWLVQLAPPAKARVNDTQVIEIMCKLQKVFQVCVSAADRPSRACIFCWICTLDPGREAQMTCHEGRIQLFLTAAMLRCYWRY